MSCTVEGYMAQIVSHIGYHEGPNNATPFGAWYGPGFGNAAWCDMYVSYCAAAAGGSDIVGRFAYTPSHAQWFVSRGQWGLVPRRGAIVFFDWSGGGAISGIDHVGTVESVDANGQIVSIDGNYSNQVARWRHPMRNVVGYGYPAYANSENWVPTASAPVVSSWDGHTFPGAGAFALGSNHPAVTLLGQMLVKCGYGSAYKSGPGIPMGPADVTNCAAFQRAQGWSGADANGYPGPATWAALWAKCHAIGATPAPGPTPSPAPAPGKPRVSLVGIRVSIQIDGPKPTGFASNRNNSLPVEQALVKMGMLAPQYADGSLGTSTFGPGSAYQRWQAHLGYKGSDADGYPPVIFSPSGSFGRLGTDSGIFTPAP